MSALVFQPVNRFYRYNAGGDLRGTYKVNIFGVEFSSNFIMLSYSRSGFLCLPKRKNKLNCNECECWLVWEILSL